MPINIRRGSLSREINFPLFNEKRRMIAEVFEDLVTESIVELVVYETFLDLNPQVKVFPNLNPDEPIRTDEERVIGGRCTSEITALRNFRQRSSRDLIGRYR